MPVIFLLAGAAVLAFGIVGGWFVLGIPAAMRWITSRGALRGDAGAPAPRPEPRE